MRGSQSEESCVTQLFYGGQLRDAAVQSCATLLSLNFDFDSFAHLNTLFVALKCDAMLNPSHLDPMRHAAVLWKNSSVTRLRARGRSSLISCVTRLQLRDAAAVA
ncbi:hypothetical protein JCGZ_02425 [Jatropha curcas]|uniref:Uncharacterized protein n=1 Tax=Jatropha curcas TaxID=180498 RepID=A0A067LQV8_JATCU|nr:hypothetical protein JCGZ_02425 [Jatropha curcas]